MGHICPMLANQYPKIFSFYMFYFRCILLQISHKKCFFINIFILGRSRVKHCTTIFPGLIILLNSIVHDIMIHAIPCPFISTCC